MDDTELAIFNQIGRLVEQLSDGTIKTSLSDAWACQAETIFCQQYRPQARVTNEKQTRDPV